MIVDSLVKGCIQQLKDNGVKNIKVANVAGAFELPFATKHLLEQESFDAAISIGVLIKGSTMHFEYIAEAVSHGLMRIGLDCSVPVIFGVLTCLNESQALERAGINQGGSGSHAHNHGLDWATTAIEMAQLKTKDV